MRIIVKSIVLLLLINLNFTTHAAKMSVERIDPPHWWAGMKNPHLQLQIHGQQIRQAVPQINYPGVTVDSVVRLNASPNWQYIYLTLSPDVKPGHMEIIWKEGRKTVARRKYELRERRPQRGAKGFSAADVLYMIMPDRFADGDVSNNEPASMRFPAKVDRDNPNVRHGGDLQGIMDHVGYIDSLGVTAVWLNPVLENDMPGGSYHGYATTDYYRVDPRFGTNADYAALIDTLHNHGIKTVMDMIFNHSGIAHPWIADMPDSTWLNHPIDIRGFETKNMDFDSLPDFKQTNFRLSTITDPYASDYDKDLSVNGWFTIGMPDLNQHNPHLMTYLTQNSIWWIEEAQIDAIRMDTHPYADRRMMADWIEAVEKEYPGFTIVGECWFGDPVGVAAWQKDADIVPDGIPNSNLRVVMDFPLMIKMRDMKPFREQTTSWGGINTVYDHLALDFAYADAMNMLRFLDNHDTERFILSLPDSLGGWKQAVAMILTIPGIPQLYYGTELLMYGSREGGDGNVRKDVPGGFPGDTVNNFTESGRTPLQNEAYGFLRTLLQWRKTSEAVAKGKMVHFMPTNGLYVYKRFIPGGDEVVILMNGTDGPLSDVDMSRYVEAVAPGARYVDILTGETVEPVPVSMRRSFTPRELRILVPESQKGGL